MSVQLPPNGTGTVIGTNTVSGKDYQQINLSDGVTPSNIVSVNAVGSGIAVRTEEVAVSSASVDGTKATYSASYKGQSAGTSATTNIFTFAGSASKTIKIVRLYIAATAATAAVYLDVLLNKQTAADTGGTAATAATCLFLADLEVVRSLLIWKV